MTNLFKPFALLLAIETDQPLTQHSNPDMDLALSHSQIVGLGCILDTVIFFLCRISGVYEIVLYLDFRFYRSR